VQSPETFEADNWVFILSNARPLLVAARQHTQLVARKRPPQFDCLAFNTLAKEPQVDLPAGRVLPERWPLPCRLRGPETLLQARGREIWGIGDVDRSGLQHRI
jgi:hypothetical protein